MLITGAMRPKLVLKRAAVFLALGLALEVVIALASTALVDLSTRDAFGGQSLGDAGVLWQLTVQRGFAGIRYTSERARGMPWSPQRATGPPDTAAAGDFPSAWASATPDGADEWLELQFAEPVAASDVRVYESFNPGAIRRISVFDESDRETVIDQGGTSLFEK